MPSTIVVYTSKYGSTEKYAHWIAEALNAELKPLANIKKEQLNSYNTIVYGGYLHAVGVGGLKQFKSYLDFNKKQKVIIFSVGCAPIKKSTIDSIIESNFTKTEKSKIQFFGLRGAFDYSKLDFIDKAMMFLMKIMLKSKKQLTSDEEGMLGLYNQAADFTNEKAIKPIVEAARS